MSFERQNIERPADLLLSELELRVKALLLLVTSLSDWYMYKLKIIGEPVTSEVRSITQITKSGFRGGLMSHLEG